LVVDAIIPPTKECIYEIDTATILPNGYYDTFCGKNYNMVVRVESRMRARASTSRPTAEPNIVQFESAEVLLKTRQGDEIASKFSTSVFAEIDPGDSSKPGQALVRIEVIPISLLKSVRNHDDNELITATIRLFGVTAGGVDVESDEFSFPIEVCSKCLTIQTAGAGCTLTEDQQDQLDGYTTCQNGQGYDGNYCFYCAEEGVL
jgi:hypothetical protein